MLAELEASREELLLVNAEQAGVINGLLAQVEALTAEVAELKRRLGLNSSNSSKPPSSDGLKKPPPRSLRKASGRKPGKQRGAVGKTLRQVENPDQEFEYRPAACDGCQASLADADVVGVQRRQVFELPEVRRQVIEHRVLSCRCECGTVSTGAAPVGVKAPVQYGPGAAAVAIYLLVAHHIPFQRVVRVMSDLLGCAVSAGWVSSLVARTAAALTGFRARLRDALGRSSVVHFDETFVRVAGRLRYAHVACTLLLTHYHLDDSRGHTAIDTHGVLTGMRSPQVAVHDGWMPYRNRDYDVTDHALCNAHHLRELTGWSDADPADDNWAHTLMELLCDGNRLVNQAKADGRTHLTTKIIEDLRRRWQRAIDHAYAVNPPPKGKGRGKILSLIDRLRAFTTEVWRFAHDFNVPFDNNQAERDVRMIKIQIKVSGTWRTFRGAETWLKIREYISTTKKHGIHTLTAIRDALLGNAWLPALPAE